jgi:predicted DNA-binding transcriptional regulator AlpA
VGEKVDVADLVDAAMIASRVGISRSVVYSWTTRHTSFPRPVATFGTVKLWLWPSVEAWLRATGRLGSD